MQDFFSFMSAIKRTIRSREEGEGVTQEQIDADTEALVRSGVDMGEFKFVREMYNCGAEGCEADHDGVLLKHPRLTQQYGRDKSVRKWEQTKLNFSYAAPIANAVLRLLPASEVTLPRQRGFGKLFFVDEAAGLLVTVRVRTKHNDQLFREALQNGVVEGKELDERIEVTEGDWLLGVCAIPISFHQEADGKTERNAMHFSYTAHFKATPGMTPADFDSVLLAAITRSFTESSKRFAALANSQQRAEEFLQRAVERRIENW